MSVSRRLRSGITRTTTEASSDFLVVSWGKCAGIFFANCLILLNGASTVVAVELQHPFNVRCNVDGLDEIPENNI